MSASMLSATVTSCSCKKRCFHRFFSIIKVSTNNNATKRVRPKTWITCKLAASLQCALVCTVCSSTKICFPLRTIQFEKYCFLCVPLSRNDSTVLISKHMISSVNQGYMMQLMIKMLQRSQRIYFEIVQLKEKLMTPQRDAAVQDEDNIQTFSSLH